MIETRYSIETSPVSYILKEGTDSLVVIFAPYVDMKTDSDSNKKFIRKSGYKFYASIEQLKCAVLYIRDDFGYTGGFNILENGDRYPEIVTISLIKNIQKKLNIPDENTLFLGEKKAGFPSAFLGLKYGYNFLSILPLLDLEYHFEGKNKISKDAMFGTTSSPEKIIKEFLGLKAEKPGLVIRSDYDNAIESFNSEIINFFDNEDKVSMLNLETQYLAFDIKNKVDTIVNEVVTDVCNAFIENKTVEKFQFDLSKSKIIDNEKIEHFFIDKKHRVIKYLQETKQSAEWLLFAFNPNVTIPEGNDVKTGYHYKFLKELPVNVVNIRDNFALNGGWYMWEQGDTYPEKLIYDFMEMKRKELNIEKKKVILFGASKGGFVSLYFAKKYGYSQVIAIAPILDPTHLLAKKINSVLGLKSNLKNPELAVLEKIDDKLETLSHYNNTIEGTIWCSDLDDMEGTTVSELFIESIPNVKVHKLENYIQNDKPTIAHSEIASEFLGKIKSTIVELVKLWKL